MCVTAALLEGHERARQRISSVAFYCLYRTHSHLQILDTRSRPDILAVAFIDDEGERSVSCSKFAMAHGLPLDGWFCRSA